MKILAIETSCEHASVALLIGGETVERRLEGHANHSEHLLSTLKRLLDEAGFSFGSLDAVAFGAGPGAFTGLRLACGVAQGLAMGAGLGVVPVGSLDALATQSGAARVLTLTDARMGEVYSAAWRVSDGVPELVQAIACTPPGEIEIPAGDGWYAIGSALANYEGNLRRLLAPHTDGWDAVAVPQAGTIARLAAHAVRRGGAMAPELAAPLYVRDKVALTTAERLARGGRA